MINNNYDTLISNQEEIFPLSPFLSEVLDEGQTLKVGVLPGTVIFPDFEESYDPLGSDDIKYFTLKDGEGLYLYLTASYTSTPIYGKMNTRDPNIAIECVLNPAEERAIKAIDEEIEELEREKAALETRIKELQDELSSIIAEIDKAIQNQQSLAREEINRITNENLTPEQRAIRIGLVEDSLRSYIERQQERKAYLNELYSQDIENIKCFIEPTPSPTTTTTTTPAPTTTLPPVLPDEDNNDFNERLLACYAFYEKEPNDIKDPPLIFGFEGICLIEKQIERLKLVKGTLGARYSVAKAEERENSIKYYVHNRTVISNIDISIVKDKDPENEEKEGSVKQYFQLCLVSKVGETLTLQPNRSNQFYLTYGVGNLPTQTHTSLEVLQCIYTLDMLKEKTSVFFDLQSI